MHNKEKSISSLLRNLMNYLINPKECDRDLLTLSGIKSVNSILPNLTPYKRVSRLIDVLQACETNEERKIVLSGLEKTRSLITFEAANDLISSGEHDSKAEASILQNINNMDPDDFLAQVEQYLRSARGRSSKTT